ncbi:alpha/beta hydrolase [Mycobacterium sp. M1]|uniref:Alpha/beta hydrolase n=1 Tax=Mycolicibacter acidiphilus TaxID=2835306 RepID=A0ABS5RMQ0_9MYCO|nr:alpha/beta hydrolase [Mycolicibacter acidiphilus]MBS9535496.1 alpha/beta hydrolase [Mycolicibacter acidiphilus]
MKLDDLLRHPPGVAPAEAPRIEGRFNLPGGRRLGYAEYGDPAGAVVLWFHGTPGGRRQIPMLARRAATSLGVRLIAVERPGTELSDAHAYESVAQWATDIGYVADTLGAQRLGVVGLSGGGPYALACGAVAPLCERVAGIAVLGGVVPAVGPDACTSGGTVGLARRFAPLTSVLRRPLAAMFTGMYAAFVPLGHLGYRGLAGAAHPGDRRVLADPETEPMLIDDIAHVAAGGFQAIIDDGRLFGRDWGFALGDVKAPVRWWHGDADPAISLADAQATVARIPDAELIVRTDESHLGCFALADEVLAYLRELL